MTKKDFELIAQVLRASFGTPIKRKQLAVQFADALQHTNPRFDRARFIAAATGRES